MAQQQIKVYVGAVETAEGFKIRRVALGVLPGHDLTKLNKLLRELVRPAGGAVWDRNFSAVRKAQYAGKRVNFLHFGLEGALPDVAAALRRAGYAVEAL